MQKILISACLLGSKVKYNGGDNFLDSELIRTWQAQGRLVSLCPEVAGGLTVPRKPCEIISQTPLKVVTIDGEDCTQNFSLGATKALALVQEHNIQVAILKESSPSCGTQKRYDGTFSNHKILGEGVTACLLREHGIKIFNENQCLQLQALLKTIDMSA